MSWEISNDALRTRLVSVGGARHALQILTTKASDPAWNWEITGEVLEGSVVTRGTVIELRTRPFPAAAVPGHGSLEVALRLGLDGDTRPGLTVELDAPAGFPFESLALPGPLSPGIASGWHLLVPLAEGHVRPVERGFGDTTSFGANGITLPMVALMRGRRAERGGLVVLSPQGLDHAVEVRRDEESSAPTVNLVQLAALGRWGYRRVWRLVWVAASGLMALAEAVRQELRAAGLRLAPLPLKLAEAGLPVDLAGSVGGTHLWWHGEDIPPELPGRLRGEGANSVVLLGLGKGAAAARDAGYVCGPYYQSTDALPPGFGDPLEWRRTYPPEDVTCGWPDQLLRDRGGRAERNWLHVPADGRAYWGEEEYLTESGETSCRHVALETYTSTQGYLRCPRFHLERVRQFALPMLEAGGFTGMYYDVLTAHHAAECYAAEHPCDRRGDTAARIGAMTAIAGSGRFVSSELGRWWALDVAHAFEGALSYGEHDPNQALLADYPFRPQWYDTVFNLDLRVPFFGMVARQSVARTFWWGHGQDRHPEVRGTRDALCALFAGNPIFVSDPLHPLDQGSTRWKAFVESVRRFDVLRERAFGASIVGYEQTSRHVALTELEEGTVIRANLGPSAAEGLAPGSYEILAGGQAL